MTIVQQIIRLMGHVRWYYLVLLVVFPITELSWGISGLAAKGVFDTLQGVSQIDIAWELIVIPVGETPDERLSLIYWIIGGLVGFTVLLSLPMFIQVFWSSRMMYLMHSLLSRNMLMSVYRRPGAEGLPDSAGEAISRFRGDVGQASGFVSNSQWFVSELVLGLLALVLLVSVDPWVTAIVFTPMLFVIFCAELAETRVQRYRKAAREATGRVTGLLGEAFGAVQAIQVATAEERILERFRRFNEERRSTGLKDLLFNNILGAVFGGVSTISLGIVLILVGSQMRTGEFTAGDFALFQFYLGWLMSVPSAIGMFIVGFQQLQVSMVRMHELMRGEPPERLVEGTTTHLWGALPDVPFVTKDAADQLNQFVVENLSVCFDNGKGVQNIDLCVNRGEFVVITGRIGSGKSTLLRAILGLLPLESGRIVWNGRTLPDPGQFLVPPRTAYVPQVPQMYSDSLKDNILFGLPEDRVDLTAALDKAVLEEVDELFEQGLDTLIGPRGVRLSGGQLQRAAAARMFVRDAELMVFDDISSALDVGTEQKLWQRLHEARKQTCIVVSHRQSVLKDADQVIVMNEGFIEAQGTLAEALETSQTMRHLWSGNATEAIG
ncbi:MAG: ABC transporter ATP-binding protein [Pseudomonadota bacterium]